MRTAYRVIVAVSALIIAWFGFQYVIEALDHRDHASAYWLIGATALAVACLIEWAYDKWRKVLRE